MKTATSRVLSKQFETELKQIYWGKKVVGSSSFMSLVMEGYSCSK
ncbi:MAG: hypothetical protein ACLFT0_13880 [Spirulinaceae cyanobacterium]